MSGNLIYKLAHGLKSYSLECKDQNAIKLAVRLDKL